MGRKKVEMKLIENKSTRQVTFSKRRKGLLKKAQDLAVLCDVEIAVVVFSGKGKIYEFCSGKSLAKTLQRYENSSEGGKVTEGDNELGVPVNPRKASKLHSKNARFRKSEELLQILERRFDPPDTKELSLDGLVQLENQLGAALKQIRSRKSQLMMQSIRTLQEKEKKLREQKKKLLEQEIVAVQHGQMAIGLDDLANHQMDCEQQQATTLYLFKK